MGIFAWHIMQGGGQEGVARGFNESKQRIAMESAGERAAGDEMSEGCSLLAFNTEAAADIEIHCVDRSMLCVDISPCYVCPAVNLTTLVSSMHGV